MEPNSTYTTVSTVATWSARKNQRSANYGRSEGIRAQQPSALVRFSIGAENGASDKSLVSPCSRLFARLIDGSAKATLSATAPVCSMRTDDRDAAALVSLFVGAFQIVLQGVLQSVHIDLVNGVGPR